MARETRDHLEASRARYAHEAGYLRRDRDRLYEKLRRLENKVRETIVIGDNIDADGLYALRQMVPAKPRKTMNQIRSGRRP